MKKRKRERKNTGNSTIYYAAINPLEGIVHTGSFLKGQSVETGQPVLFTSTSKEEVYDMVYSEWQEDERGKVSGTLNDFEYTPYTTDEEGELEAVLDDINETDKLKMVAIDRPDSTDKLLIFSLEAFNSLPSGTKSKLLPKKQAKDGKRLKKDEVKGGE